MNHAAADALVAAAAAVWNVPTSALVLAQGGTLAEHVSGANVVSVGERVGVSGGCADEQLSGETDCGDLRP